MTVRIRVSTPETRKSNDGPRDNAGTLPHPALACPDSWWSNSLTIERRKLAFKSTRLMLAVC